MGRAWMIAVAVVLLGATTAEAAVPRTELVRRETVAPDTQRLTYRYGPLLAAAGQNLILAGPVTIERPVGPGFVTRVVPDLVRGDGTVPPVERVHMHHAVMLNMSRRDAGAPQLPERFYGFAEEKTIATLPPGLGYPVVPSDVWALNYMLHNGTPVNEVVYVQYTVDFVPLATAKGAAMTPAKPLWLDVQNGSAYPVFDVKRSSGGDGRFTYPDEAANPYPDGRRPDRWRAPRDLTLVAGAGHLHPGGLHVDLHAERDGRQAHLLRSEARYFDPNGPVSWDFAMTSARPDWRVRVREGDVLRVSSTYETERASWYESMGLMLLYYADGPAAGGQDPFAVPPDVTGEPTHGHLAGNENHGGIDVGAPDPASFPSVQTVDRRVGIANYAYLPGDAAAPQGARGLPEVDPGQSLRFGNLDAPAQVLHSVTACRAPCNRSTGISYPLADGAGDFDSGSLGYGPAGYTPAAQRAEWETPKDLEPGTYTYFCRIHPFMRGGFRVRGARGDGGDAARPGRRRARGPRLRLRSRRLRVRRGAVRVPVRCAGRRGRCRGRMLVASRRRVLARGRFSVRAGRRRVVRLRLTRAGRRAVAARGKRRALLVVRQAGRAPRSTVVRVRR